ncbi:MAG: Mut7-C RNAse domain-containing protein [Acidobacteriota bacterium]
MHRAFFRFYEELNDFLPEERRKVRFTHFYTDRTSVKDMIESLGVPHSEIDLILVNGQSVDFSYIVHDDDDISVYPVFESFDVRDLTHLRQKPLREPKFVLDVHLGKLARYMRMLGLDTLYDNNYTKDDLVNISIEKRRTILTRDRNILKRNDVTHGYWVRSEDAIKQAREVIERFHLERELKEFSRCMECNGMLESVNKEEVIDEIPPKVEQSQTEFYRCPNCRKVYWKGSHYEKMKKLIGKIEGGISQP